MRHHLFVLASACSFIVFLGTCAAWLTLASPMAPPAWNGGKTAVAIGNGAVSIGKITVTYPASPRGPYVFVVRSTYRPLMSIPFWAVLLVTAILPLYWWARLERWLLHRRRRLGGLCEHCGYSLTGNISGVCPECGNAIPQKATT